MPDITMCRDQRCPKRLRCFRFTARADMHQSYFSSTPRTVNSAGIDRCEFFMPDPRIDQDACSAGTRGNSRLRRALAKTRRRLGLG